MGWTALDGIVGTRVFAVPVLAGSAAYALAESFKQREGLDRRLFQAKSFYATIAIANMAGVRLNFTPLTRQGALLVLRFRIGDQNWFLPERLTAA